jgi:catechol 2,3-dioxygenase-like lactoylglutathione lyase family enzyme
MLPIRGLYEVAIRVKDLERSEAFYCGVLGLEVGLRDARRRWLFLRAGGEAWTVVLQEDEGDWTVQHLAFTIDEDALKTAADALQHQGIRVETKSTPAALSASRSRWTWGARLLEEPGHVLHASQPLRRRTAEVFDDRVSIDAGIDKLEDSLIPGCVVDALGGDGNSARIG